MNEDEIQAKRREQDEQATRQRAAILGLQYLDARNFEHDMPLVDGVMTVEQMYRGKCAPLAAGDHDERATEIGVTSQTPQSLITSMAREYNDRGRTIRFFMISNSAFRALMRRYDPPKEIIYDDIEIAKEGDSDTVEKVSRTLESVGTDAVFDYLISQADKLQASDIHIETARETMRIRMRIDGALHTVAELSKDRYRILMGELASRSNISGASKEPQSGHIQHEVQTDTGTHLLNMRVETAPTMYGQDAVLRLFNFDETLLKLDLLGIPDQQRREIDEVISHPRGLVLMVGPTGSGKSTTMYSMLNALNSPDRKIVTLEDPIEYGLTGISQIPIDTTAGDSFAEGLRSVLRLDPDIIMVGEIRDEDTARTAIQASITGHLVLSSYHASSTSAAFSRMIDLIGVNPIFSNAIRLLIAQRLVRKLTDSKEEYLPDEATKQYVRSVLEGVTPEMGAPENLDDFKLWRPVTTDDAPFGYKGRMVIMEQMVVNDQIAKFIRGDASHVITKDIENVAKSQGMLTLEQAGVLAALKGETTIEEVGRVI